MFRQHIRVLCAHSLDLGRGEARCLQLGHEGLSCRGAGMANKAGAKPELSEYGKSCRSHDCSPELRLLQWCVESYTNTVSTTWNSIRFLELQRWKSVRLI